MEVNKINAALNLNDIKTKQSQPQEINGQNFLQSLRGFILRADKVVRGNEIYASDMSKARLKADWEKEPKIDEEEECLKNIFKRLSKIKNILNDKSYK
ncbi:hypothetical protein A3J90_05130 [candidate division WOR-1 bacterium RIFOXYC2_FULL_37_10]|uniref:Uncharacterized protein n=1 Tax=candidate division WOR-1 bacterium RIFOXYB2_FULL_37_13 TaxID=1802579 RepID=A0A1F4SPY7_UNCSA|nr:MAG: hypothetical protein A2310_00455 [candidate division WOR-1 bacterium RIFOXYB2_FULL_37_13]OGC36720.1 MAG: hypothetical protein A3J90_05130 [candidate division WOR-1 bacterium RIFOXYC2_FULL_37_10]